MAKKLYVGNLSYRTNSDALKDFFSAAGTVESANVITDKMSGRSRGFGFVEMANDDDAARAVETLNGKDLEGRNISVSEARAKEERPFRSGGGYGRDR
ncbi:MAG TPA: RNA-binding protein [Candidatus Paceibacterota bacterium]|nr:RNA-binding protein [Candidatus Paceibacterota bacterium]